MRTKLTDRLYNWASILDPKTRAQAADAASMPFIFPHVALMPDAHLGKGATVGSVIPTVGAIVPAAVGVDIGCGMIAWRTDVRLSEVAGLDRARLRLAIENAIPLSPGKYNDSLTDTARARIDMLEGKAAEQGVEPGRHAANWRHQLGSLGGGNHFIEVCVGQDEHLWLFLHSGSRGVGNKIAQRHIRVARDLCEKWFISLPDPDLAYLVEGTDEFWAYIRDLRWAQEFALLNRAEMMDRLAAAFTEWIAPTLGNGFRVTEQINCHHNYTEQERHFGRQVWLSRKGAINAEKGRPGLIPGSMGTASYVVEGLGNPLSLNSSPHGAGREHSRNEARKKFTHEQLREAMTGIEWRDSAAFLDEIPAAYKPIDRVMEDAADLVTVRHTLRQIINVKGE